MSNGVIARSCSEMPQAHVASQACLVNVRAYVRVSMLVSVLGTKLARRVTRVTHVFAVFDCMAISCGRFRRRLSRPDSQLLVDCALQRSPTLRLVRCDQVGA